MWYNNNNNNNNNNDNNNNNNSNKGVWCVPSIYKSKDKVIILTIVNALEKVTRSLHDVMLCFLIYYFLSVQHAFLGKIYMFLEMLSNRLYNQWSVLINQLTSYNTHTLKHTCANIHKDTFTLW